MDNIKRVQLSEIAELITKGTTPTTLGYEFQDEGVNFLKIECFDELGNYLPDKVAHISDECNKKLKRSQLKAGDVLFSIAGAIGRVGVVTEEMLPANTNQALAIIRISNDAVFLPYIKLILTSPIVKKQFEKKKQGVAQLNLSLKDINEISIPLPNKDKQMEYAELFGKIGAILDERNLELAALDNLIKARFVELFDNGNYHKIKLGDACKKITDGTHKTPNYLDEGITFISAKNIVNGELDFSDVKHISEEEYQEIQKRCQTEINDILLSKSGSLGAPVIVRTEEKLGLFESLAVLKYERERFLPEFLCEQLKTDMVQRQFTTGTKGVAIKHLHLGVIAETEIIEPPMEEQKAFADFVEQVDKSKFAVQKSLEETQTLFDSLMQEYFG